MTRAPEAHDADFRAFATGRWPRLLRTAYLLTGHHHDAEDLVQVALVKAYARWHRVAQASDPDAYVWRILINAHRDRIRGLRVFEWLTVRFPERSERDRTEQVLDREVLARALQRLPPRQRAAVVLRYIEDRTETEVAALLAVRIGTVRSRAARGLEKLRADPAVRELRAPAGEQEVTDRAGAAQRSGVR
ncbi:SigE family RNA polymerase sigma factor [Streptomyces carpaticus]|uniref:RNA polymerase sigma-70 factor, sigma-E family n=1 Tax=Streptomyces harbinensis TaxID=1176198 RepID=A0A1I6VMX3_9ACTN|nr:MULTISPECIES: SigE family RNA polymerase sigma factor [Streptomyces]MCK1815015.1 SigE family RNA polymerase sigma factor [Streptomyces sp. XM4011]UWM52336.1 SigE family RNA polymerase sigma factor [Streptomyces carpaticus]SFT15059.1 RNA polymerase sigma-70 factor, sigma-E family [Streptomyces harbinensis]